jgi:hypothetical protein
MRSRPGKDRHYGTTAIWWSVQSPMSSSMMPRRAQSRLPSTFRRELSVEQNLRELAILLDAFHLGVESGRADAARAREYIAVLTGRYTSCMSSNALGKEPAVHLGAFVPRELRQQLAERAAQQERSVSAELRIAIREHLADDPNARAEGE